MIVDETSDSELVRQFKAGDVGAFDAIVRRFQDRVYRLACIWLHDPQYAADAAQEVFIRGYQGLRSFRFRAKPFTWIYRTTWLVCNEFNRKRRMVSLAEEPEDPMPIPERQITDADTARCVRQFVQGLPTRQREVVILRIFEDLSVAATASAMSCREGTVKALLHKATKRLQLNMDKAGFEK